VTRPAGWSFRKHCHGNSIGSKSGVRGLQQFSIREEPGGRPRSRDEPRGVLAGPEQVSIGADIPWCEESGWAERGNGLLPLMGGAGAAFERTALFQDDLPEGRERMGH
jgi:hypothetical protein